MPPRDAKNAQLVVVGSRGRGLLTGAALGFTSQNLLHHSGVPATIYRAAESSESTKYEVHSGPHRSGPTHRRRHCRNTLSGIAMGDRHRRGYAAKELARTASASGRSSNIDTATNRCVRAARAWNRRARTLSSRPSAVQALGCAIAGAGLGHRAGHAAPGGWFEPSAESDVTAGPTRAASFASGRRDVRRSAESSKGPLHTPQRSFARHAADRLATLFATSRQDRIQGTSAPSPPARCGRWSAEGCASRHRALPSPLTATFDGGEPSTPTTMP